MNDEQEFISIKQASKIFGIPSQTLRRWNNSNQLKSSRTPSNIRMFRVADIKKIIGVDDFQNPLEKKKIIYCRVSSPKQRDDLERQINCLKQLYPSYDIIKDIGSGINFNRKGLQTLLVYAMSNQLGEVVVAHKDRIARFGFEIIEFVLQQNNAKITILDQSEGKSECEELSEDLLAIVHVFACRQMGKRRYSSKDEKNNNLSICKPEKNTS